MTRPVLVAGTAALALIAFGGAAWIAARPEPVVEAAAVPSEAPPAVDAAPPTAERTTQAEVASPTAEAAQPAAEPAAQVEVAAPADKAADPTLLPHTRPR